MRLISSLVLAALLAGCGQPERIWREQKLPSGRVVTVTSCFLVWGSEHDERRPEQDCFQLQYISNRGEAPPEVRVQEAREVFELIRGASEAWGFRAAELHGYPTLERRGRYDVFVFARVADGSWSCVRRDAKVFAND